MSAYESLASSYDALTYDVPYDAILAYLESVLQKLGKSPKMVLDLACGTGSLSVRLARRGYAVIGADLSSDMLTEAYGKALELEENRPLFICQPMQALELAQPVDLTVCLLDSINYLTDPAHCRETFRRVFENLTDGGVFFFDINTAGKLRGLDGQIFLDENDDTYCVWRAEYDAAARICRYGMDLFQRRGELWDRSFEEHEEYAYELTELEAWLREAGFAQVLLFGDRAMEPPAGDAQRVYFVAIKENV